MIKVDDTELGIAEGLTAAPGRSASRSAATSSGFRWPTPGRFPPSDLPAQRGQGRARLTCGGAHYVIDSVADLLPVLDLIEGRLARGERP